MDSPCRWIPAKTVSAVDYRNRDPHIIPRPDTVFHHLHPGRMGVGAAPLGVSKPSVVELWGKDQQIALVGYSRLVVVFLVQGQYLTQLWQIRGQIFALFLVLGQYLTQLWQVKGQIFGNSMIFQLHESISAKLCIVAAWNLLQRVPRSILHRMRSFDPSWLNI